MEKKVPVQVLDSFFSALSQPNRRTGSPASEATVDRIMAEGWAFPWQLEDLLLETDSRIHRPDIESLASHFDIPARYICRKPRFLNADAVLHEGFSATDAAALLIRLEEAGFDTAPARLVRSVLPTLNAAKYVTDSDLLVMEYARQQGRSRLVLYSDAAWDKGEWEMTKIKDGTGRRLEFTRAGGAAYKLEVRGPKHRTRPERKSVICEYCGYKYTQGDPESSLAHRSEHARMRRLIGPCTPSQICKARTTWPDRRTSGCISAQMDAQRSL